MRQVAAARKRMELQVATCFIEFGEGVDLLCSSKVEVGFQTVARFP